MKAVAIIPADLSCLRWISDCSLLERVLRKLADFRELNRVAVITGNNNEYEKVCKELNTFDERVGVYRHEQGSSPFWANDTVARYLHASEDAIADCYLLLNPCFPFLNCDTIAQVLYGVVSDGHPAAVSVIGGAPSTEAEGFCLGRGCLAIDACIALTHQHWEGQAKALAEKAPLRLGHQCARVGVNQLEIVDVRGELGWRMATTLGTFGPG